jgi:ATP-dependent RNA helicase DDX52/ROK1
VRREARKLMEGYEEYVWVGTPNHLVQDKTVPWDKIQYAVFDEADRLWADDQFLVTVDEILTRVPREATRALFSATLPEKIEDLARTVMSAPIRVLIGMRNAATDQIDQRLMFAGSEEGKVLAVRQMFVDGGLPLPVLIFVQSIERAEELYRELRMSCPNVKVDRIHAKRPLDERDAIVEQFRSGQLWALICTELMARGVDFKAVGAVINYDFPQTVLSYIHRIGRTGRGNRRGVAITLFTEDDADYLRVIVSVMRQSGCEVPDWMLKLKKPSKSKRRNWEEAPIKRESISAAAGRGSSFRPKKRSRKAAATRVETTAQPSDAKRRKTAKNPRKSD